MVTYTINPALEDLKEFIGNWEMELSNASFLPDLKTIIKVGCWEISTDSKTWNHDFDLKYTKAE